MKSLKENLSFLKTMRPRPLVVISFLLPFVFGFLVFYSPSMAQEFNLDLGQSGSLTGRVVQLVLVMTVLSLAPSILVMVTSFVRLVIVLSILRNAMGTQQTPPNIVLVSLALFLTFFIMAPTLNDAYVNGIQPLVNEEITEEEAFTRTVEPFKVFMLTHVREKDLTLFIDLAPTPPPKTARDTPLTTLIPAFMISELRRAFEIAFLLYIPFIVVDLVVASILMSMGMMMLPPIMIALPFKLIFFVLVDGWHLLAGSLVKSFPIGG